MQGHEDLETLECEVRVILMFGKGRVECLCVKGGEGQ